MITSSATSLWQVNPGCRIHTFDSVLNGYRAGSPLQRSVSACRSGSLQWLRSNQSRVSARHGDSKLCECSSRQQAVTPVILRVECISSLGAHSKWSSHD